MGFIKKTLGIAACAGAVIGSAMYIKKRKDTRKPGETYEDLSDQKYFDVDTNDKEKVKFTINTKKVKQTADYISDVIIDKYEECTGKVTEKIGEEKTEKIKESVNATKESIDKAAKKVSDAAEDAKVRVTKAVGDENIKEMKGKVNKAKQDAIDFAKEAKDKAIDAITPPVDKKEEVDTEEKPTESKTNTTKASTAKEDEDYMEDELNDL